MIEGFDEFRQRFTPTLGMPTVELMLAGVVAENRSYSSTWNMALELERSLKELADLINSSRATKH